jgi:hypothetical protein
MDKNEEIEYNTLEEEIRALELERKKCLIDINSDKERFIKELTNGSINKELKNINNYKIKKDNIFKRIKNKIKNILKYI